MRKFVALSCLTLLAAACTPDNKAIERCEESIKRHLKAPSTYKQIKSSTTLWDEEMYSSVEKSMKEYGGMPEYLPKPPYFSVNIEYDASNPMGVPIRSRAECWYGVKAGKLDADKYVGDNILFSQL